MARALENVKNKLLVARRLVSVVILLTSAVVAVKKRMESAFLTVQTKFDSSFFLARKINSISFLFVFLWIVQDIHIILRS